MARKLSVAERYIRDVLAGKILTSKLVRLQIERHERDLNEAHKRGLMFDRRAAQHVIDFFPEFLTHEAGALDGKPFVLEPFQQAKLWILYGWKWKNTGFRRFKFAYNEIGRGNCKSTEASGLCIYELMASGEAGAHVYSVSTDKKTAKIIFDTAVLMLKRNPYLQERVTCFENNVHIPGTAAKFEPCAAAADLLLGLRQSFVVFDELHEMPNSKLWDIFVSAMGKRDSPMLFACTNSGYDRHSVCWKQREYSIKVLTGVIVDDTWFAWVCGLDMKADGLVDKDDDWEDERNWIKANPGLGVMVKLKELREAVTRAKNDPSALNGLLRFRMSVWTTSDIAWMPMNVWDACSAPISLEDFRGRPCIGAFDLSSTIDVTCFGLLFPPADGEDLSRPLRRVDSEMDGKWAFFPRFYLPEENMEVRVKRDRVPYDVWHREGLLTLTPGRVVDYDYVRRDIQDLAERFDIREIVFDRWHADDLVHRLEGDGFTMVKMGQGYVDMNAPMNRLMNLTQTGKFLHGGNKLLRWMASNVVAEMDAAGNIKFDKSKSKEKIDGMVTAAMCIFRGMALEAPQYITGGVVYL